jgi:hypothetical protein
MDEDISLQQRVCFAPGDRIWHPRRGRGIVVRLQSDGQVGVRFEDSGKVEVLFPWALQLWQPSREGGI